jgi:DNA (cytosine-5)-methyltransferase 1
MRVMTIPNGFHWTTYDDTTTVENAEEYLKANELNIRRCIGEAVPTQIGKNIASKAKLALDGEAMSQAEFFNQCKDIDITSSNAKVLVTDNHNLRSYLPQIAGLLCHKDSIEIYCVDCDAENKKHLKKMLKDWDLTDTIRLTFIASTESGNYHCDLTLSDGMLKPYHKVTQIYQPSLFD